MTPSTTKPELRQQLLSQRKNISPIFLAAQSQAIVPYIQRCDWFQGAQTIFAYRSFRQELSLQALYSRTDSVIWGFPRCVGTQMRWHQWSGQCSADFVVSAYGIEEPHDSWPVLEQADLVLVPTVACDRNGYRLGYGGGYYDRMLAQSSIRTIGIVLDQFLFDQLPRDDWDHPLDAICTETGLFKI